MQGGIQNNAMERVATKRKRLHEIKSIRGMFV